MWCAREWYPCSDTVRAMTAEPLDPVAPTPDDGEDGQFDERTNSGERLRRQAVRILSLSWVPLTAATVALVLSVSNCVVSLRQPEVTLIPSELIRVAQGHDNGPQGAAYVYYQATFLSTGVNDHVEGISDMHIDVVPVDIPGVQPTTFTWTEVLRFVADPTTGGLQYQYVADAAPLLISKSSGASPTALFEAPPGWFFAAGTYRMTLVATRVVVSEPLRTSFDVTLTPEQMAIIEPVPSRFIGIRLP